MEGLAKLFVSTVAFAHAIVPGANIPQVLGVSEVYGSKVAQVQNRVETRYTAVDESTPSSQLRQEERDQKREELRTRLGDLKDQRKAKVLENLDTRLTEVKDKWVTLWTRILERLTKILSKIEDRASEVNDSELDTQIALAKEAIASAQTKVDEISAKDYVIEISAENTVGQDVRGFVASYKADLREVHALIKAARESVRSAFDLLKSDLEK